MHSQRNLTDVFARNLRARVSQWGDIRALAKTSGVSERMIHSYLQGENSPKFPAVEKLAAALAMEPWQLFVPDAETEHNHARLSKLVSVYLRLTEAGRAWALDGALIALDRASNPTPDLGDKVAENTPSTPRPKGHQRPE